MPAWPLLISNTYRCTAGDSRCSTHCSAVLHPFLMSNSHLLHLFFITFEPVAHPFAGRCCCNGTIFLPNSVGNCTFRLENLLIARPKTAARHLQQLEQFVVASCKHSDSKSDRTVWTSTTISSLEEELSGSKGGRESAGGASSDTW